MDMMDRAGGMANRFSSAMGSMSGSGGCTKSETYMRLEKEKLAEFRGDLEAIEAEKKEIMNIIRDEVEEELRIRGMGQ